jgi:RES domain-containing protein
MRYALVATARLKRVEKGPGVPRGARRAGGRWNSGGVPLVYVSGFSSVALLEVLNSPTSST